MDVMVSALLATAPMLVMLTIFLIFTLRRAKKTKNAAHYISSGYCCSMILVVVMALLAQYILAFILMLVTTIVGVVMLPKMLQAASDVAVETVVPDTSGPLRLKDFFSWYFIPKLERIQCEYKAMTICVAALTGVAGVFLFLMYLLDIITLTAVGVSVAVVFIFSLVMYCQITGRLPYNNKLGW